MAVVGQGYVGLPLALAAAESGFEVVGIDIDTEKVNSLNAGKSPVGDITDGFLSAHLGSYHATNEFSEASGAEIVILCLPTPLDELRNPDHSFVMEGANAVAPYLSEQALVINESTVAPGFTRENLAPIFKKNDVAYSPERIDPGNQTWNIKNTPKLVSGLSEVASSRAVDFYSSFISSVTSYSSVEVVETAKLLENSFRLVNISLINEIAQFCDAMGVNIQEVISAAATKPYGYMPFYPSAGAGGHCIPVDPNFLTLKAREMGTPTRLIELANELNMERPSYFVGVAKKILGSLSGKRIIVIGIAYKPNVADTRDTPADKLISLLRNMGAVVVWHDPIVKNWRGEVSVTLDSKFDLAILLNPHSLFNLQSIEAAAIINVRGGDDNDDL